MLNGNRMKSDRPRSARDYYITPYDLAREAMEKFNYDELFSYFNPVTCLDAGCGDGVWGRASTGLVYAWGEENCYADIDGVDIKPKLDEETKRNYYSNIYKQDFLTFESKEKYDLVYGNPPYSLAEEFVEHAFSLIDSVGYVYFLLRLAFLEGIYRGQGLFKKYPLKRVYVCSRRPSFYSVNGRRTTDTLAYAMFLWQKGYEHKPTIDWLDWTYKK